MLSLQAPRMLGPSISSSHKDLPIIYLAGGIFSRARSRCGHGRGEAANMAVSRHPTQRLIDQHPSARQEEARLREHWFMRTILRLQIKKSISSPWARSRYPKQGVHVSHRIIRHTPVSICRDSLDTAVHKYRRQINATICISQP